MKFLVCLNIEKHNKKIWRSSLNQCEKFWSESCTIIDIWRVPSHAIKI